MSLVFIVGESEADKLLGDFSVIKSERSAEIDCSNAAVIVGKNADITVKNALGIVVDGDDFGEKIPRGVQLITCGISPKNTVSITSRTDDKLTLSLNRTIRTTSGLCEPLEQPVSFSENKNEYDIMSAFAAKLLLQ